MARSREDLAATIAKWSKRSRRARRNGDPDAMMAILEKVYRRARRYDVSADHDFADFFGISSGPSSEYDLIDALLRVTNGHDDRRLRSRYASALKYALARKVRADDLRQFLADHGGLSGGAKRWSRWRKKLGL